ncbi:hypothetical protein HY416_01160 [Candidatus Kaiserbacteria bacterium]|nr:hypothetical protein [Candidatus Kaiserbacteria bacterium]
MEHAPGSNQTETEIVQQLHDSALTKAQEASRLWAKYRKSGVLERYLEENPDLWTISQMGDEPEAEGGSGKTALQKYFERQLQSAQQNGRVNNQPAYYMRDLEKRMEQALNSLKNPIQ